MIVIGVSAGCLGQGELDEDWSGAAAGEELQEGLERGIQSSKVGWSTCGGGPENRGSEWRAASTQSAVKSGQTAQAEGARAGGGGSETEKLDWSTTSSRHGRLRYTVNSLLSGCPDRPVEPDQQRLGGSGGAGWVQLEGGVHPVRGALPAGRLQSAYQLSRPLLPRTHHAHLISVWVLIVCCCGYLPGRRPRSPGRRAGAPGTPAPPPSPPRCTG